MKMNISESQQVKGKNWVIARFPSHGIRQQFLEQVENWNRVSVLPRIAARPHKDGTRIRLWSEDWGRPGLERLIDSYGGLVRSNLETLCPPDKVDHPPDVPVETALPGSHPLPFLNRHLVVDGRDRASGVAVKNPVYPTAAA